MANIMTKRGSADNIVTYEHICDTQADMANIDPRYCTLGSVCIVIKGEGGGLEAYMMGSDKQWSLLMGETGEYVPGVSFHICAEDEYDLATGVPIIEDPDETTFYLVPGDENDTNIFNEYIYTQDSWELFGASTAQVTYSEATESSAGLMSSADKAKLDAFGEVSTYLKALQDLEKKVNKVDGMGLSSNDYSNEEKSKLESIAKNANVNVQADWDVTDISSDAFIAHKPVLGTAASSNIATAIDAANATNLPTTALVQSYITEIMDTGVNIEDLSVAEANEIFDDVFGNVEFLGGTAASTEMTSEELQKMLINIFGGDV